MTSEVSLTALANKYQSDKGSEYKCAHCYSEYYSSMFSKYKESCDQFSILEIGLNRDNQDSVPSLDMYRDYFGSRVELYGLDIHLGFEKFNSPSDNTHIIICDQSDYSMLINKCGGRQYDIVIDDGYHASPHQQISLGVLWNFLKPGGMYIIEDLHFQPDPSIETLGFSTKDLMRAWKNNNPMASQWISPTAAKEIVSKIERIDLFDSRSASIQWSVESLRDALVIIHKKLP